MGSILDEKRELREDLTLKVTFGLTDHETKPTDEMLNTATGDTKFRGTVNILDNHFKCTLFLSEYRVQTILRSDHWPAGNKGK